MNRAVRAQLGALRDFLFPRPCARKHRYTEGGARHVLAERQPEETAKLYTYRCPHCDGYHLTKQEQPTNTADDFQILA